MRLIAWMLALWGALVGGAAHAGPLIIAPTTVEVAPGKASAVVEVLNDSDTPVDLQFRPYRWSQAHGHDELTPTADLVVSPAIATVAPRTRQTFRVLRMSGAEGGGEQSYRLKLNEIPRAVDRAVAINLEFSIPVFFGSGPPARLEWGSDGAGVTLTNSGGRRVKLGQLALERPGGGSVALVGASSSYLLAGSTRRFRLANPAPGGGRLVGTSDAGPIDVAQPALAAR